MKTATSKTANQPTATSRTLCSRFSATGFDFSTLCVAIFLAVCILSASCFAGEEITLDFSKQTTVGSPFVFGGCDPPKHNQQDAWNKLHDVGVTAIRGNLWLEDMVESTVDDYTNNVGNIQSPEKWSKALIRYHTEWMADAKSRGMKVLVIVAYAPSWLTWSGTKMGVPRDWAAWDDIVKKTYQLFQTNIDFVEVWNEPSSGKYVDDAFLDLRKSPYAPKNAEMVIHA